MIIFQIQRDLCQYDQSVERLQVMELQQEASTGGEAPCPACGSHLEDPPIPDAQKHLENKCEISQLYNCLSDDCLSQPHHPPPPPPSSEGARQRLFSHQRPADI